MEKKLLILILIFKAFISNAQMAVVTPSNPTGIISICSGTTIELGVFVTGGTLSGYQWQSLDSGGNWADITGATNETYTASVENTYRVRVTLVEGGSILSDAGDGVQLKFVTANVSITNALTDCLPISGNITLYGSATYAGLDNPPTENYDWKLNNVLQNIDNTSISASSTGIYKFVYIVSSAEIEGGSCTFESSGFTLNSCCSPPDNPTNTRINFDACSSVSSYPLEVCEGTELYLVSACPSGGTTQWYVNSTTTTAIATGTSFGGCSGANEYAQVTPSLGTTQYYASCLLSGCEGNRILVGSVHVVANPTAPTVGSVVSEICSGNCINITASCETGSTLRWTKVVGIESNTITFPDCPSVNSSDNIEYIAVCRMNAAPNCFSNTVQRSVLVNEELVAPTVNNQNICSGSTTTLSATCSAGNIKWYGSTTATTALTANGDGTFTTPTLTVNTSYFASCETGSSVTCSSSRSEIAITVQTVENPTALNSPTVCSGNSVTLTASCISGTPTWYESNTTSTQLASNSYTINNISTPDKTFYVACEVSSTCKSNRVSQTVSVIQTPTVAPSASGTTICSGTSTTLTASCSSGKPKWYESNTATIPLSSNLDGSYTTPNLSATTTYFTACETETTPSCASSRTSVNVGINSLPNVPTPQTVSAICEGQSVNLNASGCGGSNESLFWYDSATSNSAIGSGNGISVSPTTSTSYYVECKNTATLCKSGRVSVEVVVNSNPLSPNGIVGSNFVCSGNVVSLSTTGCPSGTTVQWYANNTTNAPISTEEPFSTGILNTNTTFYAACKDDISSCLSSRISKTINVYPTPPTPTTSNTAICSGNSVTLTANCSDGNVKWFDAISGGSFLGNDDFTTPTLTSNTSYFVECERNYESILCSSSRIQVEVTVNDLPIPSASSNSAVCVENSINLSATGGTNYLWAGPNTFTATGANPSRNNATLAFAGVYSVTVTNSFGCSATATTNVVVNDLPSPSASSNSAVCVGNSINLSATGGTNYLWAGPNSFTATGANPSRNNATLAFAGVYSVTVTNSFGCSATATTSVTVNSIPNSPTITSNTSTLCPSETASLSASGCTGTVIWNTGASGTSISVNSIGTYTAQCQTLCTSSNSNSIIISVGAAPNTPAINSDKTLICGIETATLQASNCNGNILWNSGQTTISITENSAGTYFATCSNNCGTSNQSNQISITKGSFPDIPTVNLDSPILCGQTQKTLVATGCTNGIIRWNQGSTGSTLNVNSSGTYSAVCENICGTSTASSTITLQFLTTPIATASNSGPYEIGQTIQLTATGGSSYIWRGNDDFFANVANPTILNAQTADDGIYTVTVTNLDGCTATATTNVVVNPCSEIFRYNYVRAGSNFEWFFPLTNGLIVAELPINTGIIGTPICQLDTVNTTSVKFIMTGPESLYNRTVIENIYPYSPFENRWFQIFGPIFPPGTYTLTSYGYSQENATGNVMFGPQTITFTVFGGSYSINLSNPNFTSTCAGNTINVNFETTGSFIQDNAFQVQLSDKNGSFENPVIIGQSNTSGNVVCQIPANTEAGTSYKIRVYATKPALLSSTQSPAFTIKPRSLTLQSPTDDYSTTQTKQASEKITATNKIQTQANVTYGAGRFILLNSGFEAKVGSIFKAEIVGCN